MHNLFSYKTKQFFWLIVKLIIVIGCGYFIYQKLAENKHLQFSSLYQVLIKYNIVSIKVLFFLSVFTFFNWLLEITKWFLLVSVVKRISFFEATEQSLASLTTSLITPNRIGEYGAKVAYFQKRYRKQVVGLNLIGNFYQMTITMLLGIVGFGYFIYTNRISIDFYNITRFLLLGMLCVPFFVLLGGKYSSIYRRRVYRKVKAFVAKISVPLNIRLLLLSFFRYLIFSHQFYLLLFVFEVDVSYIEAISTIASMYFLASIVPMLSVFDVVLKGTVAVWLFTFLHVEPLVVLSGITVIWVFNFVFPAIIGGYFVLIYKPINIA